jgi:pimeloyl-ACP methyl ester carboxylesterase
MRTPWKPARARLKRLPVLVGSSWGSIVALAFASYPALVGSLVLSAPNVAKGRAVGGVRDGELGSWLRTADISIPVSRAAIADRLLAPNAPPLVRQHVERLRDAMTTDGWRQAIRSLFTVYTPDIITEVGCPIALISGTLDRSRRAGFMQNRCLLPRPGRRRIRSKIAVTC